MTSKIQNKVEKNKIRRARLVILIKWSGEKVMFENDLEGKGAGRPFLAEEIASAMALIQRHVW